MPTKNAQITSLRREYSSATREYHRAGKKALGKPANSAAQKEYRAAKREKNIVGAKLGRLTGKKSRKK